MSIVTNSPDRRFGKNILTLVFLTLFLLLALILPHYMLSEQSIMYSVLNGYLDISARYRNNTLYVSIYNYYDTNIYVAKIVVGNNTIPLNNTLIEPGKSYNVSIMRINCSSYYGVLYYMVEHDSRVRTRIFIIYNVDKISW